MTLELHDKYLIKVNLLIATFILFNKHFSLHQDLSDKKRTLNFKKKLETFLDRAISFFVFLALRKKSMNCIFKGKTQFFKDRIYRIIKIEIKYYL